MVEDLHVELAQMMENAGRNLAELTVRRVRPASAVVLARPCCPSETTRKPRISSSTPSSAMACAVIPAAAALSS